MRILGLVPARGGSKGIPRKNLVPFLGTPLLQRAIECGLYAKRLAAVVASTDDPAMAEAAKGWGARVPFLRPADLAKDDTPSLAVVQHALRTLAAAGETYDAVCLLQPTSPLRLPEDVDEACDLLGAAAADAVVSVAPVPAHHHPCWTYLQDGEGFLVAAVPGPVVPRRQDLPPAWTREGSIYVTRTRVVLEENSLYGKRLAPYAMPAERSGNIDTLDDLAALEAHGRALGWGARA